MKHSIEEVQSRGGEEVYRDDDCFAEAFRSPRPNGHRVRFNVTVDEARLRTTGIELFYEISAEGLPAASYGAGRGFITVGFEWFEPSGADRTVFRAREALLITRMRDAVLHSAIACGAH